MWEFVLKISKQNKYIEEDLGIQQKIINDNKNRTINKNVAEIKKFIKKINNLDELGLVCDIQNWSYDMSSDYFLWHCMF